MRNYLTRLALHLLLLITLCFSYATAFADPVKGIYLMQVTLEDTAQFKSLVKNAKNAGINTFVIDMDIPSKRYKQNIAYLKQNNISYVARIVMFDGGGTHEQITTEKYWQRKYKLVAAAIEYGADQIQLDYIRYNTRSGSSKEHAKNINKILSWYKEQLPKHIPLQIDVFGISSYGEETHIGQNLPMFSQTVDVICPMVYPSHYVPFREHADTPYETVYDSLTSIQDQFDEKVPVKLVAYIELSNYHYPLSHTKKIAYIQAQLKAVKDANIEGWYAWSPHNSYDTLFEVLNNGKTNN